MLNKRFVVVWMCIFHLLGIESNYWTSVALWRKVILPHWSKLDFMSLCLKKKEEKVMHLDIKFRIPQLRYSLHVHTRNKSLVKPTKWKRRVLASRTPSVWVEFGLGPLEIIAQQLLPKLLTTLECSIYFSNWRFHDNPQPPQLEPHWTMRPQPTH